MRHTHIPPTSCEKILARTRHSEVVYLLERRGVPQKSIESTIFSLKWDDERGCGTEVEGVRNLDCNRNCVLGRAKQVRATTRLLGSHPGPQGLPPNEFAHFRNCKNKSGR